MTDQVPTLADLYQAKRDVKDINTFTHSLESTFVDGDGITKLTLAGIVAAGGYYPVAGSFETGGTLTERNQVLLRSTAPAAFFSWGGVLPKVVPAGSSVAGTGGESVNAWTNRNDGTFETLLGAVDSPKLVGGVEAGKTIVPVSHLKALPTMGMVNGRQYQVTGFYSGSVVGGGLFVWDATRNKADHNGGTVIAPEALTEWSGTYTGLSTYLNWSGLGAGCYVISSDSYNVTNFGLLYNEPLLDCSLPIDKILRTHRYCKLGPGNVYLSSYLYIQSDRTLQGSGSNYGGTVIRITNSEAGLRFGTLTEPRVTRAVIKEIKFVSMNVSDRTKYMVDAYRNEGAVGEGECFMNTFSDMSFGDISQSDAGNQMNGIRIDGTANWISDIRLLRMVKEENNENTGIAILDSGTNYYSNIQIETDARFIFSESRSTISKVHGERTTIEFINSSYCDLNGVRVTDGLILLDERSNLNEIEIAGQNCRVVDRGIFNNFKGASSGTDHGCYNFGLKNYNSFINPSTTATVWNSNHQRVYIMPEQKSYFFAVLLKNRMGGSVRTGTVEVFNLTKNVQLAVKSFSLKNSSASGALRNDASYTQSFVGVFNADQNDQIVVRKITGDYSIIKVFISPTQNANPLMVNGSAWGVAGAPSLPDISSFTQLTRAVPVMMSDVYTVPVPVPANSFSVSQFYTLSVSAYVYCAVVQGRWEGDLRLTHITGAHDGSRQPTSYSSNGYSLENGNKIVTFYFTAEDMNASPNRSMISFGAFSGQISSPLVEIDFCAVFPVL
jgi:hypothetical protein